MLLLQHLSTSVAAFISECCRPKCEVKRLMQSAARIVPMAGSSCLTTTLHVRPTSVLVAPTVTVEISSKVGGALSLLPTHSLPVNWPSTAAVCPDANRIPLEVGELPANEDPHHSKHSVTHCTHYQAGLAMSCTWRSCLVEYAMNMPKQSGGVLGAFISRGRQWQVPEHQDVQHDDSQCFGHAHGLQAPVYSWLQGKSRCSRAHLQAM